MTELFSVIFLIDKNFSVGYYLVRESWGSAFPEGFPCSCTWAEALPSFFKEVTDMDMSNVVSLISSVGFPIVACIALFLQLNKTTEMHKEEMNMIRDSIDELKGAIQLLTQKLNM